LRQPGRPAGAAGLPAHHDARRPGGGRAVHPAVRGLPRPQPQRPPDRTAEALKEPRMPAAHMRRAALLLLLALGAACRIVPQARPDSTRFYTLGLSVPSEPGGHAGQLALGLGPIILPGYLDQPQLVTRVDEERIAFAPDDRWAGSLRAQFEHALQLRLMSALDTDDISVFPW